MYRLLISFLFFLSPVFKTQAQVPVFDYKVGWQGKRHTMNTLFNQDRSQSCIILTSMDSVLALYFESHQMKNPIAARWTIMKGESMAGGFIRDGLVYFFLQNSEKTFLRTFRFNPGTGLTDQRTISLNLEAEKIIDKFNTNNSLLYLTVNRKKRELIVYDFFCDTAFKTINFKLDKDLWDAWNNDRLFTGGAANTKIINPDYGPDADIASAKNKIYIRGDSILLLVDVSPGYTRIFDFDLDKKTIDASAVFHNALQDLSETPSIYHNSILCGNRLYYASATRDSLAIASYSFPQRELLGAHRYSAKDEIDFRNSDIVLESGNLGREAYSTSKIDRTRKLINKIMSSDLFLSAEETNTGKHSVTIGSYAAFAATTGGTSFGGLRRTPSFKRENYISAYFKVLLDPTTCNKIEGSDLLSTVQRVDECTKIWKEIEATEDIFKKGDSRYYGFYDRNSRRIIYVKL